MSTRTAITIPLWRGGPPLYVEKGTETKIAIGVEKDGTSYAVDPEVGKVIIQKPAAEFVSSLGFTIEAAGELDRDTVRKLNLRAARQALYDQGWASPPPPKPQKARGPAKPGNPRKAKGPAKPGKPKKGGKPRKPSFSKETCPEFDQLQALQGKYPFAGRVRVQADGRGMIFAMPDNKGKAALAVYNGKGTFRPANPSDIRDMEQGTRTLARNKWAARVLTEEWAAE